MKTKKTWFTWIAGMTLASVLVAGCSDQAVEKDGSITDQNEPQVIKLAVPAGSMKDMVEKTMKNLVEKQGSKLEVVEVSDPDESLTKLTDGSVDAYLNTFTNNSDNAVTSIISVPTEPLTLYSKTVTREEDIAQNSTILLPEDSILLSRALLMLEDEGLIGLRTGASYTEMSVETDITDNPKNLTFKLVSADQIGQAFSKEEADLAVIPVETATAAGLTDKEELETEDVPETLGYRLVIRAADQNTTFARTLKEVIQSSEYKKLLDQNFPNFDEPDWMD